MSQTTTRKALCVLFSLALVLGLTPIRAQGEGTNTPQVTDQTSDQMSDQVADQAQDPSVVLEEPADTTSEPRGDEHKDETTGQSQNEADGDVPEQPAKIPTEEENFAVPPEKPSITLTQQDIDKMILQDPAIQEGKLRIYAAFRERLGEASLLRVIQKEYQDFGGVLKLDNNTFLRHSNQKGIWIGDISGDYQTAFIPFNQIKKRIGQLIDADRYLNERELEEYNSIVPDKNAVNSLYDVRFVYKPGDIVHLNGSPYIISAISDETVTVYQEDSPLFTEKYIRERFEELMNGDAWDNRHLVVKGSARFEIYQLADTEQTREAMFLTLQALQNRGMSVERSNYEMVYSGELKRGETLEDIYQTFNIHHPSDFMGHSLSVSDVVVLTRAGESRAYYCDEVGFPEIPDFVAQEVMQEYILFDPEERSLSWIYFNPDGNQSGQETLSPSSQSDAPFSQDSYPSDLSKGALTAAARGQIVHNKLPVDEVADRIRVLSKEELQEYVNTHSLQHVYDMDSSDAFGEYERYVGSQRCGLRLVWNPQADDEEYVAFQERIKTFARASLAVNQPQVVVRFSEHPALYEFSRNKTRLRFPFANTLLGRLDMLENAKRENPNAGHYYKTDFEVVTSSDGIHLSVYNGRYDLADGETDLLGHIKNNAALAWETAAAAEDDVVYTDDSTFDDLLKKKKKCVDSYPLTDREKADIDQLVNQSCCK